LRAFIVCSAGATSDAEFDVLVPLAIAPLADQGPLAQPATRGMENHPAFGPLAVRLA